MREPIARPSLRWIAILVASLPSAAPAVEAVIAAGVEDTWTRATQAIAIEGAAITHSDRVGGIIQGVGALSTEVAQGCRTHGGQIERATFEVAVFVRTKDSATTDVVITARVRATWWRYRKLAFIRTSRVFHEAVCDAPEIEQRVLRRLRS
jgi:hypothetical protein